MKVRIKVEKTKGYITKIKDYVTYRKEKKRPKQNN